MSKPVSEFTFTLNAADAQMILNSLGELPLKVSSGVYQRIVAQISQQQASTLPTPPAEKEVNDGNV